MDLQSPLVQQARPIFTPKIIELYNALFHDENTDLSEGFWQEFFLLRPEPASLRTIIGDIAPDELVHDHQHVTQELFRRAYHYVSAAKSPSDIIALDTLTVFLECLLNKKYTSPSSDTISVLAGLDDVDHVLTEFVAILDEAMRDKRPLEVKQRVVSVAMAAVAGAYRTGLVSYFINRDLIPSLLKIMQETLTVTARTSPLCLLSLLVNYNKFEFHNPYQQRIEGTKDERAMRDILDSMSTTCTLCRDQYAIVLEDIPEGYSLGGALSWIGLGSLVRGPQTSAVSDEAADIVFSSLPSSEIVILLSIYDFTISNKLFRIEFVSRGPDQKHKSYLFNNFLSLSSYIFQYASKSASASSYACLNLLILHTLLSDQEVAARICSHEHEVIAAIAEVRLCRQRQPVLPVVRGDRVLAPIILDVIVAGIEHNMSGHFDAELYHLFLSVILRLMHYLVLSRTRLTYHWPQLWRALTTLLTHLHNNSPVLSHQQPSLHPTASTAIQLLAFIISHGDTLLPINDTTSHDELLNTLHILRPILNPLRVPYALGSLPAMDVLLKISAHGEAELAEQEKKGKKAPTKEVGKVLRGAYERFVEAGGVASVEIEMAPYREVEWRALLKRIVRGCVEDAKALVARPR